MILSGLKIREEVESGKIQIDPFSEKQLNPNSYNLRLHDELLVYTEPVLDVKKANAYEILRIPEEGMILEPGCFTLGGRWNSPGQTVLCRCWKGVPRWGVWDFVCT